MELGLLTSRSLKPGAWQMSAKGRREQSTWYEVQYNTVCTNLSWLGHRSVGPKNVQANL